ncbi:MAG: cytochrome-c peroxidase [Armatimonadota bacterium]
MVQAKRLFAMLAIAGVMLCLAAACGQSAMGGGGGGYGGGGGGMGGGGMTKEHLGKMIYCDTNLSTPAGQSCQSCHHPTAGYADPDDWLPVSAGVVAGRYGNRNSPVSAYQATAPDFHFDEARGEFVGGQFWDGRALDLVEQAKGPFLNPLEMNNPSRAAVVSKVAAARYASAFRSIYGQNVFRNVDSAYNCIADALATYERSPELNRYNSKYDQYLAGTAALSAQELRGLGLFEGAAGCSACHAPPVFTNFTYHNVGLPRNPDNPFYYLPSQFNPLGGNWIDYGLGGITGRELDLGKFKVPTLRNCAETSPFMHNGLFETLDDVVAFLSTRDTPGLWLPPEVEANLDDSLGNLGLSDQDQADIVAFLLTLSDAGSGGGGCGGGGRMGG